MADEPTARAGGTRRGRTAAGVAAHAVQTAQAAGTPEGIGTPEATRTAHAAPHPHPSIAIGVDVGGSGIKAAAVDLSTGRFVSKRHRIKTPQPSGPVMVLPAIAHLVEAIRQEIGRADIPIGVCFPSVILDGRTMTAANVDQDWVGYPAQTALSNAVDRPVALINDADAAGLAEMRYGAGRSERGVVLVLTLGTGVGSGLFVDRRLVPSTELGHMEVRGKDAEKRSAAVQRVERRISWTEWAALLDEHLHAIDRILWPDLIIVGGGVSKNAARFIPKLTVRPRIVPAMLRNDAGIVGAALYGAKLEKVHLPPVR